MTASPPPSSDRVPRQKKRRRTSPTGRRRWPETDAQVPELPDRRALEAQGTISGALAPWAGAADLTVAAHCLGNGEWVLMALDGTDLDTLRGDMAERGLRALHAPPGSP